MNTEKILVIDLEATCWNTPLEKSKNTSEIIEIGIALLNLKTNEIEKNEGLIIRPIHSRVSAFCTKLTSLTQKDVDSGMSFAEACEILRTEYSSETMPWASYGAYDFKMIAKQCKLSNVANPMSELHLNVKFLHSLFSRNRQVGMEAALHSLNLDLEGTHHRGVDDAYNIAKILKKLLSK